MQVHEQARVDCVPTSDASTNPTLPLHAPHIRCFYETDVTELAAMDAPHIGCFYEMRHYQLGSEGCCPHRMLLRDRRYQVNWQRWMLPTSDAFMRSTLPGWLRWMLPTSDAFMRWTLPGWLRWMLPTSDPCRLRNPTLPGWHRWMLPKSDAFTKSTLPAWRRWMLLE